MSSEQVLASIQLERYYARRLSVQVSEESAFVSANQPKGSLDIDVSVKHKVEIAEKDKRARVTSSCTLLPDTDSPERPFRIHVELIGFFSYAGSEENEEELKRLLNVNAVAILYPYLRATVTAATLAANIQPIILPT
ncbi:MAG TPA: protein-export chaperone SecB, partial [Bacillota bacterium]